jgi:hypothetical protein
VLFTLGEPINWYLYQSSLTATSVVSGKAAIRALRAYSRTFSLIFLIALIAGSVGSLFYAHWRKGLAIPTLAICIQALALIGAGEVQARYMYILWYVGPLFIGGTAYGYLDSQRRPALQACLRAAWPKLAIALCALCAVLLASFAFAQQWDGRMLDLRNFRQTGTNYGLSSNYIASIQPRNSAKQVFQLRLRHPGATRMGDRIRVTGRVFVGDDAPRTLRLLVRGDEALPEGSSSTHRDDDSAPLEARILANGRELERIAVFPQMRGTFVEIQGVQPTNGGVDLTFSLVSKQEIESPLPMGSSVYFEYVTLSKR